MMGMQHWFAAVIGFACFPFELAGAQSLVRVQGPGGRQTEGNLVVVRFSPDDRFVYVLCDDALAADSNGWWDVVRQDRWSGVNTVVSLGAGGVASNGDVSFAALSANGRYLYTSTWADNLGPIDGNGTDDVYLRDLQTGAVTRVSIGLGGQDSDAGSYAGEVSDDGRFVVFASEASNLVAGDTNGSYDVFLRDLTLGSTVRINLQPGGAESPLGADLPQISADGRYVVYMSAADDLVPGDTNTFTDVFTFDRQTSTTTRVNVGFGGIEANADAYYWMRASPNARWIAFASAATNLAVGANGNLEVFLADRQTGTLSLQSVASGGAPSDGASLDPWVSDDGRYMAFMSDATTLDPNDLDTDTDLFWRDTQAGVTRMASLSTGGLTGQLPPGFGPSWGWPAMSGSGRLVGFSSNYQGLVAGDSNNGDSFVWDAFSSVPPIESFCTAKTNSQGCTPVITSGGEPHTGGSADSFFVSAHNVLNNKSGLFIWSFGQGGLPFGGGTLCVGLPVVRTTASVSGGSPSGNDCSGTYSYRVTQAYMAAKGMFPGTSVYMQAWSRDPGFVAPDNIGLSDGLGFVVWP